MAPKRSTKGPAKPREAGKSSLANKNGKKADSGCLGGGLFSWFMVIALLGVWTSVAVVYFDLVDYKGVMDKAKDIQINLSESLQGKLSAYDADGDGDFDVEDAKVLLDEKPESVTERAVKTETAGPQEAGSREAGLKLRAALLKQLTLIHQRLDAKKIAKLALAEVRQLLAKEEEQEEAQRDSLLGLRRVEVAARARERVAARLQEQQETIEREEMERAVEELKGGKEKREAAADKGDKEVGETGEERKEQQPQQEEGGGENTEAGKEKQQMEGGGENAEAGKEKQQMEGGGENAEAGKEIKGKEEGGGERIGDDDKEDDKEEVKEVKEKKKVRGTNKRVKKAKVQKSEKASRK
uniref:Aspartyl beta-hydroxylase/Triadin domain-containing protein n=1 Tax=Gadus morhua TaxID=8049 RepID=A0A8C5AZJ9_GADMO